MDIFKDLKQALRFAFALEQGRRGATGDLALVRQALNDTGIRLPEGESQPGTLLGLGEQGYRIILTVHGNLLRVETAALTAAHSRNWEERRAAMGTLTQHFHHPLARIVGNKNLIDKLVTRHYIAHRDRGAGWDIKSLSNEFKTPTSRISRAAQAVDHIARQLEAMALNSLREALNLPEPQKPDLRANLREAAHA